MLLPHLLCVVAFKQIIADEGLKHGVSLLTWERASKSLEKQEPIQELGLEEALKIN